MQRGKNANRSTVTRYVTRIVITFRDYIIHSARHSSKSPFSLLFPRSTHERKSTGVKEVIDKRFKSARALTRQGFAVSILRFYPRRR